MRVTALDPFGNPATEAAWWASSKLALSVSFEEYCRPKPEPHSLLPHPPSEPMPASASPRGGGGSGASPMKSPSSTARDLSDPKSAASPGGGAVASSERRLKTATLTLKNGEARTTVNPTIAGELRLVATQQLAKGKAAGASGGRELGPGSLSLQVRASEAEHFSLVPLDQRRGGMRVMVHARDAFGNLDESCEREVFLEPSIELEGDDGDGQPPRNVTLPGGGLVKLSSGVAELVTQVPR